MATAVAGNEPLLGVLGGMGPAATADFLLRLARLTPAACDQEHLRTILYSDPGTPDRSDAILGFGPSPLPAMLRGVNFLNQAGCTLIAIPCNSAHYWYEDLAANSVAHILHIADATADHTRGIAGTTTIGIMATDGTVKAEIYQPRLRARGFSTLDLARDGEGNPVMIGIRKLKGGDVDGARTSLLTAGEELVSRGADALIFACTDISAALAGVSSIAGAPALDASDCLALACLDRLGKARPDRSHPAAGGTSPGTTC